MSNQATALSLVLKGREAGNNRKQMIGTIERMCGVSSAYASTLYNSARKTADTLETPNTSTTIDSGSGTVYKKNPAIKSKSAITEFTSSNLDMLRKEFQDAVDAVAKKHGLKADLGSIRYGADEFRCKMTVETTGNEEVKQDRKDSSFKIDALRVGLNPNALGKTFSTSSGTYKITGVNTRRRKYPVSATNVRTGKKFKFPVSATKMGE